MTWNRLALAGALLAAFTLAACGDDEPDDADDAAVVEPAPDADAPAMESEAPAMEAEAPAMESEAPAMEAEAPAGEVAGDPPVGQVALLSLFDVTGNWAPDAAACEANENVIEIQATTLATPEDECDISSSESIDGALELSLTCAGGASESWTVTPTSEARPADAITVADGTDTTSLVRCTQ